MFSRKFGMTTAILLAVAAATYVVSVHAAPPKKDMKDKSEVVTLLGRVVDLHSHMTGQFTSDDREEATAKCIREGVPAALATSDGLVVLGQGTNSPNRTLVELAYKNAEINGNIYTKDGIRYLDIIKAQPSTKEGSEKK